MPAQTAVNLRVLTNQTLRRRRATRASPSLRAAERTGLGWRPPFGAHPLRPGCRDPCDPASARPGDPVRAGVCVSGARPTPEPGEGNNKELIYPAGPLRCLGSSRTFSEGQTCFLGRNAGAEAAPRIRARLLQLRPPLRRQTQTPRLQPLGGPSHPHGTPPGSQRKHRATGLCVPQRATATNGSPAEPAGARATARPTRTGQGTHAGAHRREAGKKESREARAPRTDAAYRSGGQGRASEARK